MPQEKTPIEAKLMEALEALELCAKNATADAAMYFEKAAARVETTTPGYYDAKSRAKDAESMAYQYAIQLIRDALRCEGWIKVK